MKTRATGYNGFYLFEMRVWMRLFLLDEGKKNDFFVGK